MQRADNWNTRALTSPTPLTDIFGKMCDARTRVSCSGSGASFSQFPPCQKISKFCDQDGSSKRRPKSIPCCKSNRNQKMSKFQDHDDSSIRRPTSTTSSALPPCEKTSRFHDRDDSSVRRETSILKNAMMNQKHSPDQSSSQSPLRQQVQEQRAVYTPTECIPSRSSLRRESVQKQMPRKISFQQQSSEAPEPQPNCFGSICPSPRPSPPPSPRAIASESSFIELANFGKTPYQHLRRKANCTPCSTPESQSMEQMASPIIRPEMSTETVVQQAPLTGRPSSICPIDDCARVSSQSPLLPNSMSIINPLFQQASPSDNMSCSKSCQPPTSPPLRAPSIIENELLPCIARQSQNVENNIRHGPRIVHRSLSPVLRQPGVSNIRPAVSFRKNSGGTGLASMRSIAGAFERGSEQSCSNSEVGSDFSDRSEYSDDHI